MKNITIKIFTASIIIAPTLAYAQTNMKLSDLIGKIANYFNLALYLLIGFAVVMFVINIIRYFILPSAEGKKKEAGEYVMWSLIGFFVVLSLWGIVNVLINTFDLGTNSPTSWTGINNLFPR